ncbi:MAG: hypothetical protein HRU15_09885 [Planctomycetes bacterium]|nr:hypothetical protein [Planctomycetota bacterium]
MKSILLITLCFLIHLSGSENNSLQVIAISGGEGLIPNVKKWNLIKEGMSEEKVIKLIGEPVKRSDSGKIRKQYDGSITKRENYGHILYDYRYVPSHYLLNIYYRNGVVKKKSISFDLVSQDDQLPKVTCHSPDNLIFDCYPRLMDIRWKPIVTDSNKNIQYEIEFYSKFNGGEWELQGQRRKSLLPYFCESWVGKGVGKYRIRAIEVNGRKGDWSEFRSFKFLK